MISNSRALSTPVQISLAATKFLRSLLDVLTVTPTDSRPVNSSHLTIHSPKRQQSARQWMPFANNNEANEQKS